MANIDALDFQDPTSIVHGGTWGNSYVIERRIQLDADAAVGDVLRFAKMQADVRLFDATLFTDQDATGSKIDLGYLSDSGNNDDPDHFLAAEALDTAGRFRANTATPPVLVPEDFAVAGTVSGALIPSGTTVTVVIEYEFIGHD